MSTQAKPKSNFKTDMQRAGLAGIASMISASCCHPIDTIKIRMQLQPVMPDGTKKYPNMLSGMRIIAMEEGMRKGIYKGIEGALLRESVYSTLRLGLYEPIKRVTGVKKDSNPVWKFLAGGASGLIGSGLANPADLLKIRMQAHKGEPMPFMWHARDVYAQGGITGFWKGVTPTMLRAMIMNGTKLAVYDSIKHALIDSGRMKDGKPAQFVAAVFAGFFQTVATAPMDNIKTRIMNQ